MIRSQSLILLIAKLPLVYPLFTLSPVLAVRTFNDLKLGCFHQKSASKIFLQIVIFLIFLSYPFLCWSGCKNRVFGEKGCEQEKANC
jgi:hypothetical protein